MQIDHHSVLGALTKAIILCDSDTEQAKDGLYALGDYLKYYFAVTNRAQSVPSQEELQRLDATLTALKGFLKNSSGS